MKISKKLILLCAIAILSCVIQTAVGKYFHAATRSSVDKLVNSSIASFVSFTEFYPSLTEIRARTAILVFDQTLTNDAVDAEIEAVRQHAEAGTKVLKQYESVADQPEDKRLAAEITKSWRTYLDGVSRVSAAVKARDYAGAVQRWKDNTPNRNALVSAFNNEIKFNIGDADNNKKEASDSITTLDTVTLALAVVVTILLAVIGYIIARSITRPLGELRDGITEIGKNLDFTSRIPVSGKDEIADTLNSFNGMIDTLQISIKRLQSVGAELSGNVKDISIASGELSVAAGSVSDAATTMAAGVEEVTVSVTHVADRTEQTNSISRESGSLAVEGVRVIDTTIRRINEIAEQVRASSTQIDNLKDRATNIGAVVGVIKEIADQTNLLALNAAIEAARAGEQGRGFAVVADEVRKLAERTSSSTQEITQSVQAIQAESNSTVEIMQIALTQVGLGVQEAQAANEAISRIRDSSEAVVEQVSEISASMREQSAASTSMAQQVERVAQMAEEFSATARHTADATVRMSELGADLDKVLSHYKV